MFKKFIFTIASFSLIAVLAGVSAHAQEAPDELVRRSTNEILAAIKGDKDLQAGDAKKIEKLAEEKIIPFFNFTRMTQLAVGRNWRDASDAQKKTLIDEFRTLLLRTYSTSLSQYRNQTIDVKPLKVSAAENEVVVKTNVNQPGGQPIPIDYSLEKSKDGWKSLRRPDRRRVVGDQLPQFIQFRNPEIGHRWFDQITRRPERKERRQEMTA